MLPCHAAGERVGRRENKMAGKARNMLTYSSRRRKLFRQEHLPMYQSKPHRTRYQLETCIPCRAQL